MAALEAASREGGWGSFHQARVELMARDAARLVRRQGGASVPAQKAPPGTTLYTRDLTLADIATLSPDELMRHAHQSDRMIRVMMATFYDSTFPFATRDEIGVLGRRLHAGDVSAARELLTRIAGSYAARGESTQPPADFDAWEPSEEAGDSFQRMDPTAGCRCVLVTEVNPGGDRGPSRFWIAQDWDGYRRDECSLCGRRAPDPEDLPEVPGKEASHSGKGVAP